MVSTAAIAFADSEVCYERPANFDVSLEISVARPSGQSPCSSPHPVVYVLDPFLWLPLVVHITRYLTWFEGFPATLVIDAEVREWLSAAYREAA